MKLLNYQIRSSFQTLTEITKNKTLPIKLAYNITMILSNLESYYRATMDAQDRVVRKYAEEGKEYIDKGSENYPKAQKELNEMLLMEHEVDCKYNIDEESLTDADLSVNISQIQSIMPFFSSYEEPDTQSQEELAENSSDDKES